jgi:hypothetical protein
VTLLAELDGAQAFHTSGRFDLLAIEPFRSTDMGAAGVDGALRDAIYSDDGVAWVLGVSGAGKSSLMAGGRALARSVHPAPHPVVGIGAALGGGVRSSTPTSSCKPLKS